MIEDWKHAHDKAKEYIADLEAANAKLRDQAIKYLEDAEKLRNENFILAAGQCCVDGGLVGDEGGTPYCTLKAKLCQ